MLSNPPLSDTTSSLPRCCCPSGARRIAVAASVRCTLGKRQGALGEGIGSLTVWLLISYCKDYRSAMKEKYRDGGEESRFLARPFALRAAAAARNDNIELIALVVSIRIAGRLPGRPSLRVWLECNRRAARRRPGAGLLLQMLADQLR